MSKFRYVSWACEGIYDEFPARLSDRQCSHLCLASQPEFDLCQQTAMSWGKNSHFGISAEQASMSASQIRLGIQAEVKNGPQQMASEAPSRGAGTPAGVTKS